MYIIIMTLSYIFLINNFQITSNCVYILKILFLFFRYISLDNGDYVYRNVDSLINRKKFSRFLFHLKNKRKYAFKIKTNFKMKKNRKNLKKN
jgi:hypothetical protein